MVHDYRAGPERKKERGKMHMYINKYSYMFPEKESRGLGERRKAAVWAINICSFWGLGGGAMWRSLGPSSAPSSRPSATLQIHFGPVNWSNRSARLCLSAFTRRASVPAPPSGSYLQRGKSRERHPAVSSHIPAFFETPAASLETSNTSTVVYAKWEDASS